MRPKFLLLFLILPLSSIGCTSAGFRDAAFTPSLQAQECIFAATRDTQGYDDNGPPSYETQAPSRGPAAPLYAPNAVTPSRGSSAPGGPLLVPR